VQAAYVYDEIRRLREAYPDTPFYAVISDLCASGGYYIAAAADEIYANEASLIGSIGVRMDSFGFVEAMDKLGVERRLLTAGEHKALLDPFLPVDEVSQAHLQDQLDEIHAQFISAVQQGRGDRLADDPSIYSGLIWTGTQAQELGLIDAFGSAGFVAREVIGAERIVEFGGEESLLERFARDLGASAGGVLLRGLTQPSLN
jgi:protease-4